eukprot:CAMPEP_0119411428 /NCGR_PEP_ID=MMETSP1335-20130426/4178_1 /TAXON_ID=259385 /ORGANISM="Chrysoculter rhomboideus, Strain RCC1486" /LENGTH=200 /DNA_ID=CAMNT_0007436065 /DNA_START=1 /DNA_END=603 /DNA_ORIENTATION=-
MTAAVLRGALIAALVLASAAASTPRALARTQPCLALSRRSAMFAGAALSVGAALQPAFAAGQDPTDLTRLVKGYKNVKFLLDNWERETTTSQGEKDADAVRKALGLRSTEDPLFQMDKLLSNAVKKSDPDRLEEWIDAADDLNTHINNANEFAYTSAFGEYNPGGGKDQILKYLELSRVELVGVEKDLKKILELLSLSTE